MIEAKILLDSISSLDHRLTTWELTYPRFIHAELLTHRLFSRNSASSRAIPVSKFIEKTISNPAMPVFWGKNQKGMQAAEEIELEKISKAKELWFTARDQMIEVAKNFTDLGLHKQIANRVIEPWFNITVILTATHFKNWFALRNHKDAQPEIKLLASLMCEAFKKSSPNFVPAGDWHLPLLSDRKELEGTFGYNIEQLKLISVGRCTRVSYLTHDGKREPEADIFLANNLLEDGHFSPWEHPALSLGEKEFKHECESSIKDWYEHGIPVGNFRGWKQLRKHTKGEHCFSKNSLDLSFLNA